MERINLIPYSVGVNIIGLPIYVIHFLTATKVLFPRTKIAISENKKNSKYYRTQNK